MVDPNTRQGKRTPVTLKIKFKSETLEQFIERYAVDVSQGGIFIRTKEPLAVGTQMKFEFQLRDASPLIAGEGTVVWTRENDPSRPAIAPGMGVRFDRLADGSQGILERILTEKAKQAPQRPAPDTSKPPLFTDTPTRVAPAPMQDALLGKDNGRRREELAHSDSHTPLPKPMPFHSDADEFPDEAFEEATKVRALDELIAQTAEGANGPSGQSGLHAMTGQSGQTGKSGPHAMTGQSGQTGQTGQTGKSGPHAMTGQSGMTGPHAVTAHDDLAARRGNGRADATPADPMTEPAETRDGGARAGEVHEAPGLPNPPEASLRPQPKLLDTSPSPRIEVAQPAFVSELVSRGRAGVAPPRNRIATPAAGHSIGEAPPLPPGMRAVAAEQTQPARLPPLKPRSNAPILILILLLVAAGGAAVWFFIIRPQQTADLHDRGTGQTATHGSGLATATAGPAATAGSATAGSATAGSATAGSAATTDSASPAGSNAPKAEIIETQISSSAEGATVQIVGTDQSGPAPFSAKLENGKPYKARITARGFATLELDLKGGDEKQTVKLVAKPRVITIVSDPPGALIWVDSGATGHTTPFEFDLTPAQAAKKTVRVQLRKTGYRTLDRAIDLTKLTEDDTRMVMTLNEKLTAQTPNAGGSRTGSPAGSAKGSAHEGSDASSGSAADTTPMPAGGSGQGSAGGGSTGGGSTGGGSTGGGSTGGGSTGGGSATSPATGPTPPATGSAGSTGSTGSAAEPEPEFNKKP